MDNEPRPPTAARIRAARLRAGLDAGTLAASLDLTFEGYRDLEDFDDSFGDHVGWDLVLVLNQPASIWDQWNIDCLADVCRELAVDWLPVLV